MTMEIRVKLLRADGGQDLHSPGAFALPGNEAILRQEGGRLTLKAVTSPSLLAVLSSLETLDEAWPDIEDGPPDAVLL